MATEEEIRWGAAFGSGRLVTPEVWEIISLLTSLPEEQRAGVEYLYALAEAWLNGCPRPEYNIAANEGGALANARGDGRNNFLYGLIADLAERTNKALHHDWVDGEEQGQQGVFEPQHVPPSFAQGVRRGFAREAPYEVTKRFWTNVDKAPDPTTGFLQQLELLEQAVQKSGTAQELSENFV